MSTEVQILGQGIYTISDAARYTKQHPGTIRAWFTGRSRLFNAAYAPLGHESQINFYNLIEVLVAGEMKRRGVSFQKIRRVHEELQKILSSHHPFCHEGLYTIGKTVVARQEINGSEVLWECLTHNCLAQALVEDHLKHLKYNRISHLVERWEIFPNVMIDPGIAFGNPVISETRISTRVLAAQYRAYDREAEIVAEDYGVTEASVLAAVEFEQQYLKAA